MPAEVGTTNWPATDTFNVPSDGATKLGESGDGSRNVRTLLADLGAALEAARVDPRWGLASGAIQLGFASGVYYGPPMSNSADANALGVMTLVPFPVHVTTTFDRIGLNIAGAGGAGACVRLGIYRGDGPGGAPSTLVVDAGQTTANATGGQQKTISQQLTPGLYWLAAVIQVAGGMTWQVVVPPVPMGPRIPSANLTDTLIYGYSAASITGALPNPVTPSINAAINATAVRVRAA